MNEQPTDFDLIVVGGGHNGLTCAAYVAAAGLRVAVLERHSSIGGAAVTEEFHPGFRNSVASYTVSLLQPKVVAELGLREHGLRVVPRPLDNFALGEDGDGLELPAGEGARRAAIAQRSRADAARYPAFAAELDRVADLVRSTWLEAPAEPLAGLHEFQRALAIVGRGLRAGTATLSAARRMILGSARDWLDGYFEDELLKGALGFDAVVGHLATPAARGSAYLLLHHALGQALGRNGAWGHAIGGMGAISNALADAARQRGAVIETEADVESIVPLEPGFEVTTSRGNYRARVVAGAVHPKRLLLDLLPTDALPAWATARLQAWRSESASFRINVALSELPSFSCRPGGQGVHHGAGILISSSLEYLDEAYQTAIATGMAARPVVEIVIPSTLDPTLAPAGAHVASLFCQHFRYRLPGTRDWADERQVAIDRVIETVDRFAPNFRRSIVGLDAYSPVDLERRFGLIGGDIFHGAMAPDQLYAARPLRRYARYRMPVPGLYLCAAGGHPGGGVTSAPGHNAARAILEDWADRAGTGRRGDATG